MSLITSPLNVAEAYCSVADADAYHVARGNATWAALITGAKEEALRKATEYMDSEYYGRWSGLRLESAQTLALPRIQMPNRDYGNGQVYYPFDVIPTGVIRACAELALKSTVSTLAPDIGRAKTRTKVDVIEVEYSEYSSQVTAYRAIDAMLRPYLIAGSGNLSHPVVRT